MVPRLLAPYRATRWALPSRLAGPLAIIGAWNPRSRRLSRSANLARERRLLDQLAERPVAVVGAAADGSWAERMWLTAHDSQRTMTLLRRFGQYAAMERAGGVWRLLWISGQRSVITPLRRLP